MKKGKLIIVLLTFAVFVVGVGWGVKIELVTDEPIVDLNNLVMNSFGGSDSNASSISYVSESNQISYSQIQNSFNHNNYEIIIYGKSITFNSRKCNDVSELLSQIEAFEIDSTTTICLVDLYADARIYESVKNGISNICEFTEDVR